MSVPGQASRNGRHAAAPTTPWPAAHGRAPASQALRLLALALVIALFFAFTLTAAIGCGIARVWQRLGPRRQLAAGAVLAMLASQLAGDIGLIPATAPAWLPTVTGFILAGGWVTLTLRAQDRAQDREQRQAQRTWVQTQGRAGGHTRGALEEYAREHAEQAAMQTARVDVNVGRIAGLEAEMTGMRQQMADMAGAQRQAGALSAALASVLTASGCTVPAPAALPAGRPQLCVIDGQGGEPRAASLCTPAGPAAAAGMS